MPAPAQTNAPQRPKGALRPSGARDTLGPAAACVSQAARLAARSMRRLIPSSCCRCMSQWTGRARHPLRAGGRPNSRYPRPARARTITRVRAAVTGSSTNAQVTRGGRLGRSPPENQILGGLKCEHDESLPNPRERWHSGAHPELLVGRQNLIGAAAPAVIEPVIAVPSGPPRAHLHQPRPDLPGRRVDRDGVGERPDGRRDQLVTREALGPLGDACANCSANHDARFLPAGAMRISSVACRGLRSGGREVLWPEAMRAFMGWAKWNRPLPHARSDRRTAPEAPGR